MTDISENVIASIDAWAKTAPDRICYSGCEGNHTYGELKARSDALAAHLSARFPGRGPIIVYGGLEFQMILCFLACVKAGHPYIPIDRHTPAERILAIAEVAKPDAILEVGRHPIPCPLPGRIGAEEIESIPDGMDLPEFHPCPISGDDDFYIIFTSGTTGGLKKAPKGVRVSHDNLRFFVDWIRRDFGLEHGLSWLTQAPFSFDLSVMNLYPALLSGGRLLAIEKEVTDDFKALFATLPNMDIQVWVSTPSFADVCLMEPAFCEETQNRLRTFLFCGEELLHSTAKKLRQRFPGATIYNLYGPTEATVAVTKIHVTDDVLSAHERLPVGSPKPGTEIFIVDENLNPLPEGKQGEILISGSAVARGYLNNMEATKAAFLYYDGLPAYRTGDAGFIRDGQLFFKGRLDFQVKLHGYRIELEDVDYSLCRLPMVEAAAVVPEYQGYQVKQLVAFVVPANEPPGGAAGGAADSGAAGNKTSDFQRTQAIRSLLREQVMEYMIPRKFVFVNHLPLSQNGKVDRKRLMAEVNR